MIKAVLRNCIQNQLQVNNAMAYHLELELGDKPQLEAYVNGIPIVYSFLSDISKFFLSEVRFSLRKMRNPTFKLVLI